MKDILFAQLESLYPEMVEVRRHLHMHPELSYQEKDTPEYIIAHLETLGIEYRRDVGLNGVVGYLKGAYPGPTVALRADFDALPIHDEKDVPYRSKYDGINHACGHDAHTATLMAIEKVMAGQRSQMHGNVVFIHQFGEELLPGGASSMIDDGCLEGVDYIYGAHVWTDDPIGTLGFRSGGTMAGDDNFTITVQGKGGHGALPHLAIDPLATASQLVMNLQQITRRRTGPNDPGVISIGSFHSGDAPNVIPDTAQITGTLRAFDIQSKYELAEEVKHVADLTARMSGASVNVDFTYGCIPLINPAEETEMLKSLSVRHMEDVTIIEKGRMMTAEDFAYYLQHVPGRSSLQVHKIRQWVQSIRIIIRNSTLMSVRCSKSARSSSWHFCIISGLNRRCNWTGISDSGFFSYKVPIAIASIQRMCYFQSIRLKPFST
ncbi:M20 metallopeptidase family protein [Salinicoccus sp. CNSTN-B1]